MRSRFEEFAQRFAESARPRGTPPPGHQEDYWRSVRDLFTADITQRNLRDLVQYDTRDTLRFFARAVDLDSLASRRWYERWSLAGWRVFLATAYRLSPPRRILFAVGVPALWLGWLWFLLVEVTHSSVSASYLLVLGAATLLFTLLLLELKDKLTLKGDLEIARQIQFGLLPFEPYDRNGVSVRSAMRPANTVGGDYFDLIDLGGDRLGVVVGDVSGKGMPAAMLMALLQGSLRTLVTAGLRGAELVARLNDHLCSNIPANRLITLFYGELDAEGTLTYVNCGHNSPFILRRDGSVERLAATAVALGILAEASFETMTTPLDAGDRLVLFTDGISEAESPADAEYSEARIESFLVARRDAEAGELIAALLADVLEHCGSNRPRDDMTLLVLSRA